MKTELIHGLSFREYQAIPALNMSLLKELDDSPGRLDWRRRNPWKPTDPAILGNAIHTLLLEPGEFARRYITAPVRMEELPDHFVAVPPEHMGKAGQLLKAGQDWVAALDDAQIPVKAGDWGNGGLSTRSSAYKAWKLWTEAQGLTVLTISTTRQARSAAGATWAYKPARELIDTSAHEVTLVWQDEQTGLWCKGRMDNWDPDTLTEADIKTTGLSVHWKAIGRTAYLAGWHIQRAYYGMGMEAITGGVVEHHKVIAVEVDEPWRCEVYEMGLAELELGRHECRVLLGKYRHYNDRGEWPMNSGIVPMLQFPGWAFKEQG